MKSNLKRWRRASELVVLALVVMMTLVLPAWAHNANPRVIPPNAHAYGKTLGGWCAAWWQWNLSLPLDQHPGFDMDGTNASRGQHGPVWFLAGDFTGSSGVERDFTVPAGRALLVSLISVEASTLEQPPFYGKNRAELRAAIRDELFDYGDLSLTVDGVAVQDLDRYLVESPLFRFTVPADNILGVSGPAIGRSVAKGCFLILAPLPVGDHVIHVEGAFPNAEFIQDITYNIKVAKRRP